MKKKLAFSIAGATAVVIGGWKLVQQLVDSGGDVLPVPSASAPTATPRPAPVPPLQPDPVADPEPVADQDPPRSAQSEEPDKEASKSELYGRATELGIKGRSKMSKKELRKAIRDAS